eukprot:g16760.t1
MNRIYAFRQKRIEDLEKNAPPDTSAKQVSALAKAAAQIVREKEEQELLNRLNEEAKHFLPDISKGALVQVPSGLLGGHEDELGGPGLGFASFGHGSLEHGFFSSSFSSSSSQMRDGFTGATLGGEVGDDYDFRSYEVPASSSAYGNTLLPIEDVQPASSRPASSTHLSIPDRLGGAKVSSKAGVFQVLPQGKDDSVLSPVIAAPNKLSAAPFTFESCADLYDEDHLAMLASPAKTKPLKSFPKDGEVAPEKDNKLPENPNIVLPAQCSWKDVVKAMKKSKQNGLPNAQFAGAIPAVGDSDEESVPIPGSEGGVVKYDPFNFDAEITTQAPASVKQYKTQYLARYVDLMKALGLSSKRGNVTPDSLTALFKAFWVCGDFPRSKVQYFSWIKSYMQKVLFFTPQLQSTYSKYFRVLSKARPAMSQEAAIRLSTLIQIIQSCEESMDFIVIHTKKKNTLGRAMPITVNMVIRHVIACWFAFLRPNESSITCRAVSYSAGRWNVRHIIPFRKNSQRQPVALDMVCCCSFTPWLKPPTCPVHCATDTQWRIMNTYVDDDEWRHSIRHLVYHAGFPLKVENCRHKWGSYSVRIGGAQSARDAGTDEEVIRKIGWWSSDKTSQHYQGFAGTCADSIAIEWPIRQSVLFSSRTHSNN